MVLPRDSSMAEKTAVSQTQTTDFWKFRQRCQCYYRCDPQDSMRWFSREITQLFLGCVTLVSEGSFVDLPGAICFPNGDTVSLVHHLKRLLHDGEQRKRLGAQARDCIFQTCTHQVQAERIIDIYSNLLKS